MKNIEKCLMAIAGASSIRWVLKENRKQVSPAPSIYRPFCFPLFLQECPCTAIALHSHF